MPTSTTPLNFPRSAQKHFDEVTALTDAVCSLHLDAEYAEMARRAVAALCRKRPCPLARGQARTWACGVLYALGQLNFLNDKSQTPSMSMTELCKRCGVGASSGGNKAAEVRELLGIRMFDHRWTLHRMMDSNPGIWLIQVNGFIVDARNLPVEVQQVAVDRGIIPHVVQPKVAA